MSVESAKRTNTLDVYSVRDIAAGLETECIDILGELVSVNSYSENRDGVRRVFEILNGAMPKSLETNAMTAKDGEVVHTYGCLVTDKQPILLVGHLDTIFPPGLNERSMIQDGPYLYGPGVSDMKGGLVVILGVLRAMEQLGVLDRIPLMACFSGDEEIGSPRSKPVWMDLAEKARLALVFECGGPKEAVITSRRGVRKYDLRIEGETGYAGHHQGVKKSALVELAHQILRLEAFNKPKTGFTLNVGYAEGGGSSNEIPGKACAEMEIRYWDEKIGNSAGERIMASLASPITAGLELKLHRTHSRPAMVRNPGTVDIYKAAAAAAKRCRYSLPEMSALDASDANILAACGLPVLDGLGPEGEGKHTVHERIVKSSISRRIEVIVHLLWDLCT